MQNHETRETRRTLSIREEAVREIEVSDMRDDIDEGRFEMAPNPNLFEG